MQVELVTFIFVGLLSEKKKKLNVGCDVHVYTTVVVFDNHCHC